MTDPNVAMSLEEFMNMEFPKRSWHLWKLQGSYLVYDFGRYEIDLREITSAAKMLDFIFQIAAGKVWATNECVAGLDRSFERNLRPAGEPLFLWT